MLNCIAVFKLLLCVTFNEIQLNMRKIDNFHEARNEFIFYNHFVRN